MPLVSIIVPVYNAIEYLDDCIRSITEQTLEDIEILLVDDGSTDDSFDVLRKWENRDSRIKVIHQQNSGVSAARRKGVELASGDWVSFVDADDTLPSQAIALMYKYTKEADLVVGQVGYVGPSKWTFSVHDEIMSPVQYIRLMYSSVLHSVPFARLFKKELFSDPFVFSVPKEITHGEDTIMNYRIATRCKKIRTVPNIVYTYIIRDGSASHQNKFASLSYCHLYEKIEWMSFPETIKKELLFLRWNAILQRRKRCLKMKLKQMFQKFGLI